MVRAARRGAVACGAILIAWSAGCAGPPTKPTAGAELDRLRIVASRPDVPGYDRSCGAGHRCVFGPAWTDDVDVQFGHDGCDQRSGVLRRDLVQVTLRSGTHGCVVQSGILDDPYTGTRVGYRRGANPPEVVVDHVFSLAAAWDLGASAWTPRERANLAGDPRNLITTTAAANASKGDRTPADWLPPAGRCRFARAYVDVAAAYDLAITSTDRRALRRALSIC